jgi:hypothetical protein
MNDIIFEVEYQKFKAEINPPRAKPVAVSQVAKPSPPLPPPPLSPPPSPSLRPRPIPESVRHLNSGNLTSELFYSMWPLVVDSFKAQKNVLAAALAHTPATFDSQFHELLTRALLKCLLN